MVFCINKTDKILVVAPHPDDESIGCGDLLAQMISAFVSQLEDKDYLNAGMGLSQYRGISCGSCAAEGFYRSDASVMDKMKRFVSKVKKIVY